MTNKTRALERRPAHVLTASVERHIFVIRGHKVMVDSDLAELYRVPTKVFNQAVKRNLKRFPSDFMFRLSRKEMEILRSQIVTSSWGGRRNSPYAFTEQGVAMLSSVLNSERAVQVNIAIMRAFVKLREILATHRELAEKIEDLEKKYRQHDTKIQAVFDAIRQLLQPPVSPRRRIGFAG
ncbi:MAG TPA: ORF6N domain-containing protein [Bryobacteraceae bacterium]|nr:ORF6N domain-containing protein [Bryobacteraceae bacterium]